MNIPDFAIPEFRKSLRDQLREAARASYGKPIISLSKNELKLNLDNILKWNYNLWKLGKYGSLEEYKELFRDTFKKELKIIKQDVK